MVVGIKLEYEDLRRMPNDLKRHEILDGDHYNHAAPMVVHQQVSLNLDLIFAPFVRRRKLGQWFHAPTDVELGRHDIVQPDHVFIARGNRRVQIDALHIVGVPDVLIEILSQGDPDYDRVTKKGRDARFGVRHYWIVEPEARRVEVFKLRGRRYVLVNELRPGSVWEPEPFPGLRVKVAEIFPGA